MKTRYYATAGLLTYILFLITSAPATTIYHFKDQFPKVSMQGLSGTLWNGHAQRVTIAPQYILDELDWSFCAWRLLTGELCLEIDANYQNKPLHSQIGTGLGGTLRARDLGTEVDAHMLGKLLGLPIGEASGMVSAQISSATWNRGSVPRAEGTITWSNAAITIAESAQLGTIIITITETDKYPMTAVISNKGGDIALNGHANIVEDGTYNLELDLSPTSKASNNIRNSLGMFAKKQAKGNFVFKNSGNLKQFGLM